MTEHLKLASSFVLVFLASASVLSAPLARAGVVSAACHGLFFEDEPLVLHGELEQMTKAGRWQEAAWRALEAGQADLAKQIEAKIEHRLLLGKIFSKEMMPNGSSDAYLVKFDDGTQAVFKPNFAKGWKKRVRPFHDMRMPIKEIAAYRLDRLLKVNMIPVTVHRTIDGQFGSLQVFVYVDHAPSAHVTKRNSTRLTILDYVAQIYDRTPPNILKVDGGPVAIDNAMSFLLEPPHLTFGIQWPPRLKNISKLPDFSAEWNTLHQPTEAELQRELGGLLTPTEIEQCLVKVANLQTLQISLAKNPPELTP